MPGRYIDDEIAEKRREHDALQREIEKIGATHQKGPKLERLAVLRRELEELERKRAGGA